MEKVKTFFSNWKHVMWDSQWGLFRKYWPVWTALALLLIVPYLVYNIIEIRKLEKEVEAEQGTTPDNNLMW